MFNSKKIAAAVGVLGSFALIGAGAVQAFADDSAGGCVDNGNGYTRCSQVREYQVTSDKRGNITVVNDSTQSCPASGGQIACVSSFSVPDKKS
ncbi:hypothetical protein [Streptomyces djakartensis]|uniref:Uncharacterized protein n=1 Tax=Streptomyces djakartensis TaxID=68193 RepID=A0ABQ2ZJY9_9ACTN|nr:hypothetical protein [Streptomyces djakartensis]GGY18157.1 hypothetical protein GCM10010384_25570 [Streptomyces djakartensis]